MPDPLAALLPPELPQALSERGRAQAGAADPRGPQDVPPAQASETGGTHLSSIMHICGPLKMWLVRRGSPPFSVGGRGPAGSESQVMAENALSVASRTRATSAGPWAVENAQCSSGRCGTRMAAASIADRHASYRAASVCRASR